MQLTADAIHNWGEAYVLQRYASLPIDVKVAAMDAMRRHHQQGTDAQAEADLINARFGLQEDTPGPAPTP